MNLFGKPNLEKIIAKKNIKGLLKALEYKKDVETRRKAAEALGQLGDISAVGPLRAAAGDEEVAVRMAAIEALGKFEEKPSVATLLKAALHDKQDSVRRIAARIVARYSDQVLKDVINRMRVRLVRATSNEIEDKYVEAAVRVVAEVGKPAVNPLITVLREEMDRPKDYAEKAPIKAFAAKALGRIGDSRAITPLGARLKNISMPEWIRRYFVQALAEIDDPRAIKPLAAALKKTQYFLAHPSAGLGGLTNPSVAGKVAANNQTRVLIIEALASFDDPEVIPILINRFKDKSEKVFDAAHQALIKIGTPAVEPLIEALSARSTKVRNYAAQTLGRIGDKRAVEHIIPLLEDRDEKVPQGAASALGWLGDELAVEPLIKALEHKNILVRQPAAGALGTIGDPRAIKPLISAIKTELPREKPPKEISENDWLAFVTGNELLMRQEASGALVAIGMPAVDELIKALDDKSDQVRGYAAASLGRIGAQKAISPLKSLLSDDNELVRKAAREALDTLL